MISRCVGEDQGGGGADLILVRVNEFKTNDMEVVRCTLYSARVINADET